MTSKRWPYNMPYAPKRQTYKKRRPFTPLPPIVWCEEMKDNFYYKLGYEHGSKGATVWDHPDFDTYEKRKNMGRENWFIFQMGQEAGAKTYVKPPLTMLENIAVYGAIAGALAVGAGAYLGICPTCTIIFKGLRFYDAFTKKKR